MRHGCVVTLCTFIHRVDVPGSGTGGAEELFNSLDLVAHVDAGALVRYTRVLGHATAAGALGS